MDLRLERQPNEHGTPGDLFVDDVHECVTLERPLGDPEHPAILYGRYPLTLRPTYNQRLWTPSDAGLLLQLGQRILPHIEEVPGRAGIELHAGNGVEDTQGCVIVALMRSPAVNVVYESRRALIAVMTKLVLPCWITLVDAKGVAA